MDPVGSVDEPEGRALTAEPIAWKRHWRVQVLQGDEVLKIYKVLQGVRWDCPDCSGQGALELRERSPRRYWFHCRRCKWQQGFNHVRADELVSTLGAPIPK